MSNAGVALMGLGKGVGEQRSKMAAQNAANSPLLETNIQGAKRLLVNVTAGSDFSIGEAHEAMEYILQFTDAEDADIIMGHVLKETDDNEVMVTLLAAGMDPGNVKSRQDVEVFVQPQTTAPAPPPPATQGGQPQSGPIQLDELDLDIQSFIKRTRMGRD